MYESKKETNKSHIPDQQGTIRTSSDVFWTVQLARNVSKDDEQYFPRTAL